MIGKVVTGRRVGGLMRYLYGPGRANEHTDPHLAGAWTAVDRVEPIVDGAGRHDVKRLVGLLEAPLHAAARSPEAPVWHCALRAAPGDRVLTDAEWDAAAREVLHRTGLAPAGDHGACRWVAVRHAEDHVHLVATLARQDGRYVSRFRDFYRVGEACRAVEERYGLTLTGARDRTAAKRPTRAETEKAVRSGQRETPRVQLTREVRYAAAATSSEANFFAALREAGVLVRPRYSQRTPEQVTGYAVALAGDRSGGDGGPVWFSGGKLSADLTWPRLQTRMAAGLDSVPGDEAQTRALAETGQSSSPWGLAADAARAGTAHLVQAVSTDPALAGGVPAATADVLIVVARAREGRHGGPLSSAADRYHRASQEPWARPAPLTVAAHALHAAARALAAANAPPRSAGQEFAKLLNELVGLVEAVQQLRAVQRRDEQAAAARQAATLITTALRPQRIPPPGPLRREHGQLRLPLEVPPAAHRDRQRTR